VVLLSLGKILVNVRAAMTTHVDTCRSIQDRHHAKADIVHRAHTPAPTAQERIVARISDRQLITRLETLAERERTTTLAVLLDLNEVERRSLHLSLGYGSLFDFATKRLRYSESAAGRRIAVARCIRKYPEMVDLLRHNEVNLSTIGLVSRVITPENGHELLRAIRSKSQREVETIVAAYNPVVRIRDRMRAVSWCSPGSSDLRIERGAPRAPEAPLFEDDSRSGRTPVDTRGEDILRSAGCSDGENGGRASGAEAASAGEPVAPQGTFRVQFAAGPAFVRKFEEVHALLSARFPKGASFEEVLEAGLDSFLEHHSPQRRAARRERRKAQRARRARSKARKAGRGRSRTRPEHGEQPGTQPAGHGGREPATGREKRRAALGADGAVGLPARSRHIPAEVRDEVHARDGGRCTYVGADGVRCGSRHRLQIDHVTPVGKGGLTTSENLRLLCAAHNHVEAEREYGSEWMSRFRRGHEEESGEKGRRARGRRAGSGTAPG
jgi:hypothetical protein